MTKSPDTNAGEMHASSENNRFQEIDKRVTLTKDFWQIATNLHLPSQTSYEHDYLQLSSTLDASSWPHDIKSQSDRYIFLSNNKAVLNHEEENELSALQQNPDLRLYHKLAYAAIGLSVRRQEVRETITQILNEWHIQGEFPEHILPHEENTLQHAIIAIDEQKFSLQVSINTQAFHTYLLFHHLNPAVIAFYERHTPFAFCDAQLPASILEETYRHEDFHSFMDASNLTSFADTPPLPIQPDLHRLGEIMRRNRPKAGTAPSAIYTNAADEAQNLVREHIYYYKEELLANLASSDDRNTIMKSTYADVSGQQREDISGILRTLYPDLSLFLRPLLQYITPQAVNFRLQNLYQKVSDTIPEKRLDTDIAFALFPIDQVDEIEKLVDYWITQKSSQNPS